MKKIFLILIFANFIGLNQIAFSDDPPCGGTSCDPWTDQVLTFALSDCPDCSVDVAIQYSQSCNEYYVRTITYLNEECTECTLNGIFKESVQLLLKYGPASCGMTTVNDKPCWELKQYITNGWRLQPCIVDACCQVFYVVDKTENPPTVTRVGLPIRIGEECPEGCTEICSYDYHPRVLEQPDEHLQNLKSNTSVKLIPIQNNQFKVYSIGNIEGTIQINFYDYLGKSFKNILLQKGLIKESNYVIDLSQFNGLLFYNITLDGEIVGSGKIIIAK